MVPISTYTRVPINKPDKLNTEIRIRRKYNSVIKPCCNSRFERYRWIQFYSTAPIVISLSYYCSTIILFAKTVT